jgi:hypothetical protein
MALWSGLLARPSRTPLYDRPSLTLFFLLAGAFIFTLLPHVAQFPYWLSTTLITAIILRGFLEVYRLPLPSIALTSFLAIVFLGLIFATYGNIAGTAGTAFTAGLIAIKFYEIRRPRDVALIIFSCFFVVMSSLLYSQVLELFIYCLIMMWVLTALLLRVHTGDSSQDRVLSLLGISGGIFMQALPLMLFLFVFFPRYNGTISFHLDESKIGLSDTLSPGSISKLSQDESEAMYVKFLNGIVPATDSMYIRGIVMWDYANGEWTTGIHTSFPAPDTAGIASGAGDIKQQVTVKAHNQLWLFALDVPISIPLNDSESSSWATLLNGNIIQLSTGKLNHQARYMVTSSPQPPEENMNRWEKNAALWLPKLPSDHIDPGVVDLADKLHAGLSDDQETAYISNVLKNFHRGGFVYSAAPGKQSGDWLANFLLRTKTGFCEHYAAAFAVLMRLQHIPCRVIAGYLGAEYNPYSDLYVVTQSNAHAWDEVWVPTDHLPPNQSTQGYWKRVDPTALVGSGDFNQLANRGDEASDAFSKQIASRQPTFAEAYLPKWARTALKEMQLRREQVEAGWDDVVFSYDPEAQIRLAQALGFGSRTMFGLFGLCLVVIGMFYILFRKLMARKPRISPIENLYANFCRHMAKRGLPRASWEGPLAYTERVAESFPEDKPTLKRVGNIVARARYGPEQPRPETPEDLKSLLTLLTASQAASTSRERS